MVSIGGSVKRLPLTSLVVTLALVSGCGVLRDTTAASVDGRVITIGEVEKLAAQFASNGANAPAALGVTTTSPGTMSGDPARQALSLLVRRELLRRALRDRHGTVTDADRSTAASEMQQQQVSKGVQYFAGDFLATAAALFRMAQGELPTPALADVAAYYQQHAAEFVSTCFDALIVQADTVTSAKAALTSGTSFAKYLAAHPDAQAPSENGVNVCVSGSDPQAAQLAALVGPMAVGVVNTQPQTQGGVAFIKVTSHQTLTLQSPGVAAQINTALKQSQSAVVNKSVNDDLAKIKSTAAVSIDPRFGTWDPKSNTGIVAPPTPLAPSSTTTALTVPVR